jgi:hypothetical protein
MSEQEKVAEVEQPKKAKASGSDVHYTREDLLSGAGAFGISREAMAGALRAGDITDGGTKKQVEDAIKAFKQREV